MLVLEFLNGCNDFLGRFDWSGKVDVQCALELVGVLELHIAFFVVVGVHAEVSFELICCDLPFGNPIAAASD
jgi:hypothetical protein